MAESVGISTTAIDKNIVALKKKGLLRRIGSPKGGYWEVMRLLLFCVDPYITPDAYRIFRNIPISIILIRDLTDRK